jgi:hypothetical protein
VNRFAYSLIGPAPANITLQSDIYISIGGVLIFLKECHRGHNLPGLAVATLGNLFLDPGQLDRVVCFIGDSFNRGYLVSLYSGYGETARPDGIAIQKNRTGPALGDTTSEFRSFQSSKITYHPQKRHLRIHIGLVDLIVDSETDAWHMSQVL